jgi:crossover junction endodeoxyribonuclease RuvC
MVVVFGIDPGLTGGIAVFDNGRLIAVHPVAVVERVVSKKMKRFINPKANAEIFTRHQPDAVYIEEVGAMPGQGVTSMWNFGFTTGVLHGLSAVSDIRTVRPMKWKTAFGLIGAGKDASRRLAMEMFPEFADRFRRAKDDGLAEAALIGAWGLSEVGGL